MTAVLLVSYAPQAMAAPSLGDQDGAGERKGATRLKFQAGDSVLAQVDVGSGNLLVSVKTLPLVGAKGATVQTGAYFNSALVDDLPKTERLGAGRSWRTLLRG